MVIPLVLCPKVTLAVLKKLKSLVIPSHPFYTRTIEQYLTITRNHFSLRTFPQLSLPYNSALHLSSITWYAESISILSANTTGRHDCGS